MTSAKQLDLTENPMRNRLLNAELHRRLAMQLLILLGIATFLVGVGVLAYLLSLPPTGFELGGGATVGAVASDGPAAKAGLRVGDQVLSINGLAPMSSGQVYLQPGQKALELEIRRGGAAMEIEIILAPRSLAGILDKTGYFFMALGFWIIATVVLAFKPRDSVARTFILLCLLATTVIVIWPMADLGALWANLLMTVLVAAIGPLFVRYHTLFPERIDFRGRRALLASLYGIGAALAMVSLALDAMFYTGMYRRFGVGSWPSAAPVLKAYFVVCLLIGLGLLVRTYRTAGSERSKRQIALVLLGTVLALLPLIAFILVPQILFSLYLLPPWLPLLMLGFIPASYLYATYRHNLMRFDRAVNRSVVYFVLSLCLVLLYLGLEWAARSLWPANRASEITIWDVVTILILLFALQPVKRRTEILVDRFFFGGWYNYESFTQQMARALNGATDMDTIRSLLTQDVARTMRVKEIALLLPGGSDAMCVAQPSSFEAEIPDCASGALTDFLCAHGQPIEHSAVCKRLASQPAARAQLAAYSEVGVQVWVPLVEQVRLVGILVLGNKVADEFYSKADYAMLLTLAQHAATAIARARIIEEHKARVDEVQALTSRLTALQERNQQRMAKEIHDQAVQDVLFVRRLLESALREYDRRKIEGAYDELKRIAADLEHIIFELRPPELEQGELGELLQTYATRSQRRLKLDVAFECVGSKDGSVVPDEVKLAIYRIFQESLHNAAKHAQAEEVLARLELQPDGLCLEVKDNGTGFEVPTSLSALINGDRTGLVGMQERAREVGGTFELESHLGRGTHIVVRVPLRAPVTAGD